MPPRTGVTEKVTGCSSVTPPFLERWITMTLTFKLPLFHIRKEMPYPNKILPELKVSNRQRIINKIQAGQPFTLKSLHKRIVKPKIKIDTIRYHISDLVTDLLVQEIPRTGAASEPQTYIYRNMVPELKKEITDGTIAADIYGQLESLAWRLRQGLVVDEGFLRAMHIETAFTIKEMEKELKQLGQMVNCRDLWQTKTLVQRIGFLEDEEREEEVSP